MNLLIYCILFSGVLDAGMPERLFRCAADIQFDDDPPVRGKVTEVRLKPFSETCNYLQYQRPLTAESPCFFAQIKSLSMYISIILWLLHSSVMVGGFFKTKRIADHKAKLDYF